MSLISGIFGSYKDALDVSQDHFEKIFKDCALKGNAFYESFLHKLIVPHAELFSQPPFLSAVQRTAEKFFQRSDIDFIAIDGTCLKDPFQEFMVFFGASYGVRGQVNLTDGKLKYKRWSMDNDVSHVAYVPIPYAEAGQSEDTEGAFVVSDIDKLDLSSIHTRLMQLAEIYLAYQTLVQAAIDHPRIILMDLSPSSVLMSTEIGMEKIGVADARIDCTSIRMTLPDIVIAYSHPFNIELGIPAGSKYRRYAKLISWFSSGDRKEVGVDELASDLNITVNSLERTLLEPKRGKLVFNYDRTSRKVTPKLDIKRSWHNSKLFFSDICYKLFIKKDPTALLYIKSDNFGVERTKWMTPDDVAFLISTGLRALIELCWERKTLLIGIVKDSSTAYFSRHYLGLMRHLGKYASIPVSGLPWTDRMLLESISYQQPLMAPWSTIEIDSCFMTLHLSRDTETRVVKVSGMRGDIVNPERLFARSLAQFFISRNKKTPLMGHVIFIDRLLYPELDKELLSESIYSDDDLGSICPFLIIDKDSTNYGSAMAMYLLQVLTRNLFPEVIGYPDPLHKADWGAKSVADRVRNVIKSSEYHFRTRPLSKLFRTIREEAGR